MAGVLETERGAVERDVLTAVLSTELLPVAVVPAVLTAVLVLILLLSSPVVPNRCTRLEERSVVLLRSDPSDFASLPPVCVALSEVLLSLPLCPDVISFLSNGRFLCGELPTYLYPDQ